MKTHPRIAILCTLIVSIVFTCCKKSDNDPPTGTLKGIVKDASTSLALENVNVVVFNADNNSPIGQTLKTNAAGEYSTELLVGNYFVKLSKQGYNPVPSPSLEAVPFTITGGQQTQNDAELFPSSTTGTGWIQGKVTSSGAAVQGALVVATDAQNIIAFSTSSDVNGDYSIFNVPSGSFTVRAYLSQYNSNAVPASITSNTATLGINVEMQKNASASLVGSVRNLSIENKEVDIALVHPITKETIPGLTTATSSLNYSLTNIPNGSFIARATYKNDVRVMDPDRIAKFGEPVVTVTGGVATPTTLTFDVTGPVTLNSPTNPLNSTVPVTGSIEPTFQWTAYPSTTDYVIEVMDAATGQVIWGGFDKSGALPVKKVTIPGSETSIAFNADASASISSLVVGKIYRWRIYASKNDQNSPTGWTLISVSEDQVGLIKVNGL